MRRDHDISRENLSILYLLLQRGGCIFCMDAATEGRCVLFSCRHIWEVPADRFGSQTDVQFSYIGHCPLWLNIQQQSHWFVSILSNDWLTNLQYGALWSQHAGVNIMFQEKGGYWKKICRHFWESLQTEWEFKYRIYNPVFLISTTFLCVTWIMKYFWRLK